MSPVTNVVAAIEADSHRRTFARFCQKKIQATAQGKIDGVFRIETDSFGRERFNQGPQHDGRSSHPITRRNLSPFTVDPFVGPFAADGFFIDAFLGFQQKLHRFLSSLIPAVFNFEGGGGCGYEGHAKEQGQDHGRASSFCEFSGNPCWNPRMVPLLASGRY